MGEGVPELAIRGEGRIGEIGGGAVEIGAGVFEIFEEGEVETAGEAPTLGHRVGGETVEKIGEDFGGFGVAALFLVGVGDEEKGLGSEFGLRVAGDEIAGDGERFFPDFEFGGGDDPAVVGIFAGRGGESFVEGEMFEKEPCFAGTVGEEIGLAAAEKEGGGVIFGGFEGGEAAGEIVVEALVKAAPEIAGGGKAGELLFGFGEAVGLEGEEGGAGEDEAVGAEGVGGIGGGEEAVAEVEREEGEAGDFGEIGGVPGVVEEEVGGGGEVFGVEEKAGGGEADLVLEERWSGGGEVVGEDFAGGVGLVELEEDFGALGEGEPGFGAVGEGLLKLEEAGGGGFGLVVGFEGGGEIEEGGGELRVAGEGVEELGEGSDGVGGLSGGEFGVAADGEHAAEEIGIAEIGFGGEFGVDAVEEIGGGGEVVLGEGVERLLEERLEGVGAEAGAGFPGWGEGQGEEDSEGG